MGQRSQKPHTRAVLLPSEYSLGDQTPNSPTLSFEVVYERTELITEQTTTEFHYGITSQPPDVADPKRLLEQCRGEWTIENQNHWRRDVTMHEDASQVRQGHAPQVLAALNTMVISLVLSHGSENLASFRRQADYTIDKGLHEVLTKARLQVDGQRSVA